MNYVLGQDHPVYDQIPEPGFNTAPADVTYVLPGGVIAPGQGGTSGGEVVTITDTGVQVTNVKLNEPPSLLRPILLIGGGLLAIQILT